MIETPLTNGTALSKELFEEDARNYPLGRYGKPEEIAYSIVYLLSDATVWMTGSQLLIDGGYSVKQYLMGAYIKAISYYLPQKKVTNEQLVEEFPEWSVDKIAKKVGINERHIAAEDETAGDMAYKAAEKLIEENAINKETIDFVLLCTQSPDYFLPSTSCIIQSRLGLSTKCGAFDFNLGCSGYEYGLAVAKGLIISSVAKNILLLSAYYKG